MESNIKIELTAQAPNIDGLCVVLTTIKPRQRHNIKIAVKAVISSKNWSNHDKRFISGQYAIEDNKTIEDMISELTNMANTGNYDNGKRLKSAYEDGVRASSINHDLTFGEYLSMKLEGMKSKAVTTTHECYNTLNNKMQGISNKVRNQEASFNPPMYQGMRIYDLPLKKINNAVFKAFIDWILNDRKGEGFINTCTCFKAIMSEALLEGLTEYQLTLPFRKHSLRTLNLMNWRLRISTTITPKVFRCCRLMSGKGS